MPAHRARFIINLEVGSEFLAYEVLAIVATRHDMTAMG
jgi:hypothetical protein